jgi:hypothetical protein
VQFTNLRPLLEDQTLQFLIAYAASQAATSQCGNCTLLLDVIEQWQEIESPLRIVDYARTRTPHVTGRGVAVEVY